MSDQQQPIKATQKGIKPANISDKQQEVLLFVALGIEADPVGRSPKLRWIGQELGIGLSSAWERIMQLRTRGCLEGEPDRSRSLTLTDLGRITVEAIEQAAKKPESTKKSTSKDSKPSRKSTTKP